MTRHDGVLLTNLGTPDAPTPSALRRYLAEFLWDRRVVDLPRLMWWLLLHGVILRVRPRRSARLYQKIWTDDGSPLLNISQRQLEAIRHALGDGENDAPHVLLGMRYGRPSIATALEQFEQISIDRLLILPLYPQYSSSTTASTFDAVAAAFQHTRWMPELHIVRDYYTEPGYRVALTNCLRETWKSYECPERLLFSFHGLPERYAQEGDPYPEQCRQTAESVASELGLSRDQWEIAFQSRFGRKPWLQPYTDERLRTWASDGIRHVHVICPGFSADSLETLGEIGQENRDLFLAAGGSTYRYIPALNDRADHIALLVSLIKRSLAR